MTKSNRANKTGNLLENFTSVIIEEFDYIKCPAKDFNLQNGGETQIYSSQCQVGTGIYGHKNIVDFLLYHPKLWPNNLIIQCKWQSSGGSVDQKYPYEVLCIHNSEVPSIIILDGGGYSPGAEKWLKDQVGEKNLLKVLNQGEFHRWANKNL